MLGRKHTKETRSKMSKSQKKHWTPEYRKRWSEKYKKKFGGLPPWLHPIEKGHIPWNTGKKLTKEHKKKISDGVNKVFDSGYEIWNKGKNSKEDPRIAHGDMFPDRSGKNNPCWEGGKSFEAYGSEFNEELKMKVRKNYDFKCQECGVTEFELGMALDVHHFDGNKKNNSIENLAPFCRGCHMEAEWNSRRR